MCNVFDEDDMYLIANNADLIRMTIESRIANVVVNDKGETLLMIASHENNLETVWHLLNTDINVDTESIHGYTALTIAVDSGNKDITEMLIEYGSNVNHICNDVSILMYAVIKNNIDIIELLIKAGADVNYQCSKDITPIIYASIIGSIDIVNALISSDAYVNHQDTHGCTALMYASYYGHLDIVKVLLNAGATHISCNSGLNAYNYALYNNHHEIVEILPYINVLGDLHHCQS